LKIAFHESDRASAEATNLKLQAYVEMARALHIRQQAEREVVEIRNKNGQVRFGDFPFILFSIPLASNYI
jgi:hypothetical protein